MALYLYRKIRDKRQQQPPQPWTDAQKSNELDDFMGELHRPSNDRSSTEQMLHEEQTAAAKQEKSAMRRYRWRLIAGLFIPASIQALNTTMLAGALPFIASDFNQLSQLNWIVSAYNLTAAAFIPFWGQMADVAGRYITLQAAAVVMILGSALCAGAPTNNFAMFLAGRGLEGVGSAGFLILSKVILADKVSLQQNAKNNTVFTVVIGVAYSIGPVVGGYLTAVTWRWVFIINIPLSVVGIVLLHFVTRPLLLGPQAIKKDERETSEQVSRSANFTKRLSTIDFGGQVLFLFGIGLLVLALTWGGSYYPWSDAQVIGPLVSGAVLTIAFVFWEYLLVPGKALSIRLPHQRAMIPIRLLWARNGGVLTYINFITGMAMYAVFYFAGLYFTIARGFESDKAGTSLLYYLPGLGVGAYLAIFACNRWPRKTWPPLAFGTVVEATGITCIAAAIHIGDLPTIYGMIALTGVGTGIRLMPGTLHGVGYYRTQIASVVSIMNFANSFGGTMASTIMLNIFNNKLGISLVHGTSGASSFNQIDQLPPKEQEFVRARAQAAIVVAFYGISAFMWLGVVAMAFLGNVDIKKDVDDVDEEGQTSASSLAKGSYVASWCRRSDGDDVAAEEAGRETK
ncbi:uncharacterized protein LTR77_002855 [Saxophila tyrrhenica]|uniref:Major facilitator superfamily (MFS) profile domain-containing protein n=1 Tax=Saxophila tyrrhenica TaxID=1690608 RepID=A0AAV9PGL4_9PEZI|nr:hypothetical protein LTR77_002855 [Saxophila tyrrhenica]